MTSLMWIPADWPAPDGVVAGCSTRRCGVSEGRYASLNLGDHVGDDPAAVTGNRERLVAVCGLPQEPAWLRQIHGSRVAIDPAVGMEADASLTGERHVVCAVMVADCLPVLFCRDDGSQVAAAHAGWRGLASGVLEATLDAFSDSPQSLMVWLGPAISQSAFEVGDEVREAFIKYDGFAADHFIRNDRGRWLADLHGLARQRLAAAGVERIFGGEYCTYGDGERFFSHRRDGTCGRMAALIFRC